VNEGSPLVRQAESAMIGGISTAHPGHPYRRSSDRRAATYRTGHWRGEWTIVRGDGTHARVVSTARITTKAAVRPFRRSFKT